MIGTEIEIDHVIGAETGTEIETEIATAGLCFVVCFVVCCFRLVVLFCSLMFVCCCVGFIAHVLLTSSFICVLQS